MNTRRKITSMQIKFHNLTIDCDYLENMESNHLLFLIHPNPIYGGSKNESFFNYIFSKLYNSNISVFRFNFVNAIDEIRGDNDYLSRFSMQASLAFEYIKTHLSASQDNICDISIVGLSTGGMIGLNLMMRRLDIKYLFMISPTVMEFNLGEVKSFDYISNSTFIYYGGKDAVTSADKQDAFIKKFKPRDSKCFETAGHLFTNHEEVLLNKILSIIKKPNTN